MELRDLYILSELIRKNVDNGDLTPEVLEKAEIHITFTPITFYGVDKEFYYMTHNNSYDGFSHSDIVNATINGVKFNITAEEQAKEQTTEGI